MITPKYLTTSSPTERRLQRPKRLIIFKSEVLDNSNNILHTLHSVKEKVKDASYWVFTPHQLSTINTKLNIILGHDKHDVDIRLYSIYGIKVKKSTGLQNRKSWSFVNIYLDLDGNIQHTIQTS